MPRHSATASWGVTGNRTLVFRFTAGRSATELVTPLAGRRGIEPRFRVLETRLFPEPSLLKLVPHARIRTCYLSLTRRVLIHISFCGIGTPGGSRTHKIRFLRPAPMPIRLPGHWWRTSESNRAGDRLAKAIRLPRAFPWCFVLESNQASQTCKVRLRSAPEAWRLMRESNPP